MHTHTGLPQPGDLVWIRQRRWRVESVRRDGRVVRLDVSGARRITFLAPFDLPARAARSERPRGVTAARALGRLARLVAAAHGARTPASAVPARAAILPHQLEPALAFLAGARRVLLADEVGLGKTVQAGLIAAELARRDPRARALVVAPAGLCRQWRGELTERFGLEVREAGAASLAAFARETGPDRNPWLRSGVWLASLDYLKQPHVAGGLPLDPWDLLVVDEAHAACGDSERHAVVAHLARAARRVLLLTATPHGGDATRFERLLDLGSLEGEADGPVVFRRTWAGLGAARVRRVRWPRVRTSPPERAALDALLAFERALLSGAPRDRRDAAILLLAVFRKRALSTWHAFAASLERRLAWLDPAAPPDEWRQPALDFDAEGAETSGDEESAAIAGDAGMPARRERAWLRRLLELARAAGRADSRLRCLARLAGRTAEPVVVFTEYRRSLEAAARVLARLRAVAVAHGGQSEAERHAAISTFLSGRVSVLLATDVAGQGLNLQSRARWVVNLDVPWNPVRLEQRAGRVDRIGQTRTVHVTTLRSDHAAESPILARLARRALLARAAVDEAALAGALPDEAALCAPLLEGREPAPAAPVRLDACRRWTRAAAGLARRFERARALTRGWRGPAPDSARPWQARLRNPGDALRAAIGPGARLLVFSVPLLDGSGGVVEQHVRGVVAPEAAPLPPIVEAARRLVRRRLGRRAARVAAIVRARARDHLARERAIAAALEARLPAGPWQPGIFDRRAVRRAEAARRLAAGIRRTAETRAEAADREASIHAGRPVLELVLARGR